MGNGGTITIKFNANTSSFTSALKQAENQIKGFAEKNKSSFSSIAKTADGLANKMTGVLKTFSALSAAGGVSIAAFTKSAGELQSLRASFSSLTGTVEETNKVMNTLYQYGKMTAFDNASIQQSAKMFLANGVAVDDLMGWMKNLGDVAGATGADLQGLALPLTQAISKGKLQTQDWYQIINQGAGGLQKYIIAALGAGYSQENFSEALEDGAVTAEILRKALETASAEGGMAFEGAKKQSETYAGRLSNLQEQITNTGLAILGVDAATGEVKADGLFAKISDKVKNATEWLERNKETILNVASVIVDNLVPASVTLFSIWASLKTISFVNSTIEQFSKLTEIVKSVNSALKITQGLKILGGGIWSGLTAVLGIVKAGFFAASGAVWSFTAALLANPITWIVIAIAAAVAALTWFFTQTEIGKQIWQGFMDFLVSVWNGVIETVKSVVGAIVGVWNGMVDIMKVVVGAIVGVRDAIVGFLAPIADVVWRVVSGLFIAIVAIVATIVEVIFNIVVGAVSFVASIIGSIAGFFVELWSKVIDGITGFISIAIAIISTIVGWIQNNVIVPVAGFFVELWNGIVAGVVGFVNVAITIISTIVGWISDNIIAPIAGFFSGLWNGIVAGVSGFVQGTMNIIMPIANWINNNIIQPISRFFTGLWNGVVSGIKGMADGIRTAFSSIMGIIKAPINGLIDLINGVIGGIISTPPPAVQSVKWWSELFKVRSFYISPIKR